MLEPFIWMFKAENFKKHLLYLLAMFGGFFLAAMFFSIVAYFMPQISIQSLICYFIAAFFFTDHILKFIDMIIAKIRRGLNGRDELWPWCVRRFLEYPALGYGFIASETVPTVRVNLVLAHNTLLQWLTSTGIIGTSLMVYFYIRKYKAVFSGARSVAKTFIILAVICVELTGMMDQAAAMDIFVFSLPVLLLAGADTPVREMQAAPMPRAELSFGAV